MTEHAPAVVLSHPPVSLLHAANPLVRLLLRTPLAGGLRTRVMVVSVTGHRTGHRYSIPLSSHRIDGDLYALSSAPWKHNFHNGAAAEVLLGGRTTRMRGLLIEDRAVVADLSRRCAESYGAAVEDFADAVDRHGYAAVRFT